MSAVLNATKPRKPKSNHPWRVTFCPKDKGSYIPMADRMGLGGPGRIR